MNQADWYANGLDESWRQIVNTDIFKIACQVVIEDAFSAKTPPVSLEVNALYNQYREGMINTIRDLRSLAIPKASRPEPLSKPWERKTPEEEELPPGPQPPK